MSNKLLKVSILIEVDEREFTEGGLYEDLTGEDLLEELRQDFLIGIVPMEEEDIVGFELIDKAQEST